MAVSQYVSRQTHIFGDQFEHSRKSEVRFYTEKQRERERWRKLGKPTIVSV